MDCWGVGVRNETHSATRFVFVRRTNCNSLLRGEGALRIVSRLATLHTDGVGLGDVFGYRQKLRHRFPWFSGVVLIEPGDDHAHAATRESVSYFNKAIIEKLSKQPAPVVNNVPRANPALDLGRTRVVMDAPATAPIARRQTAR